ARRLTPAIHLGSHSPSHASRRSAMAFVAATDPASEVRVVDLGPLALLKPLIDKLDIAAVIDRHLPSDAEVSHGAVLAVLLAARLHSPTALVNVADWAQQH